MLICWWWNIDVGSLQYAWMIDEIWNFKNFGNSWEYLGPENWNIFGSANTTTPRNASHSRIFYWESLGKLARQNHGNFGKTAWPCNRSVGRSVPGPCDLGAGTWDVSKKMKNQKSRSCFSVFANGPLLNWGQLVRDVFKILNAFGVLSAKIDVFLTSLASATVDLRWLVSVILQRRRSHTDTSQHLSCLKIFLLPIWSPSSTFKCANTQRQRWSTKICAWKKDLLSSTKCSVRKLLWF